MYKIFVLIFLAVFLISPKIANAAVSISTIGNLDPNGAPKPITISGLDINATYYWLVSKVTSRQFGGFGGLNFTPIQHTCINTENNTEISRDIGPYQNPGIYRLEISKADPSGSTCIPRNLQASQDFSVGGLVNPPDGQDCCPLGAAFYRDNHCHTQPFDVPGDLKTKTDCEKGGTFCEPQSLKCFQSQTLVIRGKTCKEPGPDFDEKENVVCGFSGGKTCTSDPNNPAIQTAIGCIHTSPAGFTKDLLTFIIGIGGGLAFLMMLLGAFQMLTSAGNPETLAAGRQRLTSAVIGLLFVVFAVLLLQIIGADILKIEKFER